VLVVAVVVVPGVAVVGVVARLVVLVVIMPASGVSVVRIMAVGAMPPAMGVAVPVPLSAQVQDQEDRAGREQDAADDEVGVAGDGRPELQPDADHDAAQQQGHHDVSDGGGQRQARHRARAVAAGAGQDRQRQPVVGHDCVPEGDPGRGEQEDRQGVHTVNLTLSYAHQ
jgi:hypothetical protein